MTNIETLNLMTTRYNKIIQRGKAFKCPGVLKKLRRQMNNLNK